MSSNSPTDPPAKPAPLRRLLARLSAELKAPRKSPIPPEIFRRCGIRWPFAPGALRRFSIRALFVLACLATLVVAFFMEEKIRGRAAWRAYEREATARGTQLDFAAFIPPAIPDSENFASTPFFDAAFRAAETGQPSPRTFKLPEIKDRTLPTLTNPVKRQRIDLAAWQQYLVESKLLPAAGADPAADVLLALEAFAGPLAELDEAGTRPHCRFPVQWEKGFEAGLPHLGMLQEAAKLYALRCSAHLARGDSAAAYEDFRAGLRLTTATSREPPLIAGLVRISIVVLPICAVWGGLADQQWAEPELRKIEADLAAVDWLRDYQFAMSSERAGFNTAMDITLRSSRQLAKDLPLFVSMSDSRNAFKLGKNAWGAWLYPAGWVYQSKVMANRFLDQTLARIDPDQRRYFPERPITVTPQSITTLPKKYYYLIFVLTLPAYQNAEGRWVHAATLTDFARFGVAIERARLARGTFPGTLSELAPDYLPALPAEIVNGEPYRYRRTEDGGYAIHSVGWNLRDDGGSLEGKGSGWNQADWVWSVPGK